MIRRQVLTSAGAEILHLARDLGGGVGYAVEQRRSSGATPGGRNRMAFGDEELMGLRTQLIEAGHGPRGERVDRSQGLRAPQASDPDAEAGLGAAREGPGPATGSEAAGGAHSEGTAAAAGGRRPEPPRSAPGSAGGPRATPPPGPSRDARERDEFLAMLGHELRNPLAPMQQAVELLQAHSSAHDPDELRQARTVLARQVDHLTRLCEVLLGGERRSSAPAGGPSPTVALVRRVVELHGGRVSTHGGAPGGDTELRVWLPAAAPPEPAGGRASRARREQEDPRARQILVVDDNEDAAEMLALVLRKRGYPVVLAFDGEEALAMAQAHRPEVVLLDIGLPGIDGYEVARRLRAEPPAEHQVLVAVTGYGQPADRQRSREAGFDHHLVKPVAMEKLLTLLEPGAA